MALFPFKVMQVTQRLYAHIGVYVPMWMRPVLNIDGHLK